MARRSSPSTPGSFVMPWVLKYFSTALSKALAVGNHRAALARGNMLGPMEA